jgi:hypothetical protein
MVIKTWCFTPRNRIHYNNQWRQGNHKIYDPYLAQGNSIGSFQTESQNDMRVVEQEFDALIDDFIMLTEPRFKYSALPVNLP